MPIHHQQVTAPAYVQLSPNKHYFTRNGKYFFMLADTVWYAIPNATKSDWIKYLQIRKEEGFNTLLFMGGQDQRDLDPKLAPFKVEKDGKIDYNQLNPAYFKKADEMLSLAVQYGFTPAIAVLWSNEVQDTWTSKFDPSQVMPLSAVNTDYHRI